eukprot:6634725-Lingulodinium_polyedra.AAC.1
MDNCTCGGDGAPLWLITHGVDFEAKLIPLGAQVIFRPSEPQGARFHKFEPADVSGVFLGYELKDGYRW